MLFLAVLYPDVIFLNNNLLWKLIFYNTLIYRYIQTIQNLLKKFFNPKNATLKNSYFFLTFFDYIISIKWAKNHYKSTINLPSESGLIGSWRYFDCTHLQSLQLKVTPKSIQYPTLHTPIRYQIYRRRIIVIKCNNGVGAPLVVAIFDFIYKNVV